jgi:hypothetical protein
MSATNDFTDPIVQSAARWFWWIAGMSLVNVVLFHAGSQINFVVGLGMTTIASIIFASSLPMMIGAVGSTIGFYFVIGLYAQRGKLWAFYLGIAVYVLDALIYVKFEDWMSVGFHALAIFFIAKGIARVRELQRSVPAVPAAEPDQA